MDPKQWTATEAAYVLSEAHAANNGEAGADPDYGVLNDLASAMDADPDYTAEIWNAWREEMKRNGCTEAQMEDARSWLNAEILVVLTIDTFHTVDSYPLPEYE